MSYVLMIGIGLTLTTGHMNSFDRWLIRQSIMIETDAELPLLIEYRDADVEQYGCPPLGPYESQRFKEVVEQTTISRVGFLGDKTSWWALDATPDWMYFENMPGAFLLAREQGVFRQKHIVPAISFTQWLSGTVESTDEHTNQLIVAMQTSQCGYGYQTETYMGGLGETYMMWVNRFHRHAFKLPVYWLEVGLISLWLLLPFYVIRRFSWPYFVGMTVLFMVGCLVVVVGLNHQKILAPATPYIVSVCAGMLLSAFRLGWTNLSSLSEHLDRTRAHFDIPIFEKKQWHSALIVTQYHNVQRFVIEVADLSWAELYLFERDQERSQLQRVDTPDTDTFSTPSHCRSEHFERPLDNLGDALFLTLKNAPFRARRTFAIPIELNQQMFGYWVIGLKSEGSLTEGQINAFRSWRGFITNIVGLKRVEEAHVDDPILTRFRHTVSWLQDRLERNTRMLSTEPSGLALVSLRGSFGYRNDAFDKIFAQLNMTGQEGVLAFLERLEVQDAGKVIRRALEGESIYLECRNGNGTHILLAIEGIALHFHDTHFEDQHANTSLLFQVIDFNNYALQRSDRALLFKFALPKFRNLISSLEMAFTLVEVEFEEHESEMGGFAMMQMRQLIEEMTDRMNQLGIYATASKVGHLPNEERIFVNVKVEMERMLCRSDENGQVELNGTWPTFLPPVVVSGQRLRSLLGHLKHGLCPDNEAATVAFEIVDGEDWRVRLFPPHGTPAWLAVDQTLAGHFEWRTQLLEYAEDAHVHIHIEEDIPSPRYLDVGFEKLFGGF